MKKDIFSSIYKRIVVFMILIWSLSNSLFAIEFSKIDIEGIKLGMNKKELAPTNCKVIHDFSNGITFQCRNKNMIDVEINTKTNKVTGIASYKNIRGVYDWRMILKKMYEKYGQPDDSTDKSKNQRPKKILYAASWGTDVSVVFNGTKNCNCNKVMYAYIIHKNFTPTTLVTVLADASKNSE